MKLLCADTDLSPETKLKTVCKTCRCIHIYSGRIDLILKLQRMIIIICDDRFRMSCIIFINMTDRFINRIHCLDRNNRIEIFRSPIILRSRFDLRTYFTNSFISTDLDPVFTQLFNDRQQRLFQHTAVNYKRFTCVADSHPLCLCIFDNICRHTDICRLIHIHMTVSRSCFNNRNRTVCHNICDQTCASSRDKHIDQTVHLHHFIHNFPACILNKKNKILTKFFFAQSCFDHAHDCLI